MQSIRCFATSSQIKITSDLVIILCSKYTATENHVEGPAQGTRKLSKHVVREEFH